MLLTARRLAFAAVALLVWGGPLRGAWAQDEDITVVATVIGPDGKLLPRARMTWSVGNVLSGMNCHLAGAAYPYTDGEGKAEMRILCHTDPEILEGIRRTPLWVTIGALDERSQASAHEVFSVDRFPDLPLPLTIRLDKKRGEARAPESAAPATEGMRLFKAADFKGALPVLLKEASGGSAEAQNAAGEIYRYGWGVAADHGKAFVWHEKAAKQGVVGSMSFVASALMGGYGAPKNVAEGVRWFRKAAEKGDVGSQTQLGDTYLFGIEGVPVDCAEAARWYRQAAAQDSVSAKVRLHAFERGDYAVACASAKGGVPASRWAPAPRDPAPRGVAVVDMGRDGSVLMMKEGWNISAPYYLTRNGMQVAHAFGNGEPGREPVHVEMAVLPKDRRSPRELAEGLRTEFLKMHAEASGIRSKILANKKVIYYVVSVQPDQARAKAFRMLDGFIALPDRYYYVNAIASVSRVSSRDFERAIPGLLEVVGTCMTASEAMTP